MMGEVSLQDLLERKDSFFVSYEINIDEWNAENFNKEVDYFDLEDMLVSRFWLKHLEKNGKLSVEELDKLNALEHRFFELKIPEFVKKHFPGIYEKWIK